jgi:nucleotide-binding universal stress UspA family protein
MYERILVPLDGSEAAENVLPYAEQIATKFEAEIILVSVSEPTAAKMDHLYRSYLERVAEKVQRQLKDWGAKKRAKVPSEVLMGKPATEILRYADENNVDLIIMASRGGSGEGPWLLGNIASKVLQVGGKPILLIRASASGVALQQKKLVKRILVPLDGSEVGEVVIPHVEALARALGADVILFHVLEPTSVIWVSGIEGAYAPVRPEEEARRAASELEYLDGVGKTLEGRGLSASTEVGSGSPAGEIIRCAETKGVDLVAMSTHGRSGIGRWALGSITEKVLQAGNTAVLTIRAAKE